MALLRPLLIALPSLLVACGDDGQEPPSGPHYTYVADKALVPTTNAEATDYGLDLDGDKINDNALGKVLATLKMQAMFDIQGTVTEAVNDGSIILLLDFQTPDFQSAGGAGLTVKLGDKATAMPAPCTDPTDPATCGKHLTGTGVFTIPAGSPSGTVVGKVSGGTFNGGPGNIALQLALAGDPITLNLIGARARASGLSADSMDNVILAGALSKNELDTVILPAIHKQVEPIVNAACTMTMQEDCGCPDGSAHQILMLLDTSPKDCRVTLMELQTNGLITSLTAPDVDIEGVEALSLGLKVTTKKAMFPAP